MTHRHDASYKLLFAHPDFVRDLLTGFTPDTWLHALDFSTLERYPVNYVTDELERRDTDIVWRLKVGGEWAYLYLLIDHQSRVDKYMALRLMTYVALLYQNLIKGEQTLPDGRLPPVLPIVLYNGPHRWTAPLDIAEIIPVMPDDLCQYQPKFRYLIIDKNAHFASMEDPVKNLVAAIFRLESPKDPDDVQNFLRHLNGWLDDRSEIRRTLAKWLRATLMQNPEYRIVLPEMNDLEELSVMLSDQLAKWAKAYKAEGLLQGIEQGIEQGYVKGMQRGEVRALERQLVKRFGMLPTEISERIAAASPETLDAWLLQVLDATSLDDIFEPTKH